MRKKQQTQQTATKQQTEIGKNKTEIDEIRRKTRLRQTGTSGNMSKLLEAGETDKKLVLVFVRVF